MTVATAKTARDEQSHPLVEECKHRKKTPYESESDIVIAVSPTASRLHTCRNKSFINRYAQDSDNTEALKYH